MKLYQSTKGRELIIFSTKPIGPPCGAIRISRPWIEDASDLMQITKSANQSSLLFHRNKGICYNYAAVLDQPLLYHEDPPLLAQ